MGGHDMVVREFGVTSACELDLSTQTVELEYFGHPVQLCCFVPRRVVIIVRVWSVGVVVAG